MLQSIISRGKLEDCETSSAEWHAPIRVSRASAPTEHMKVPDFRVYRLKNACGLNTLTFSFAYVILHSALYRDETKLQTFRGSQASKSSIDIYSCAGKLIRRINWDQGSIKGLGWTEDEKLIVVTADGTVRCYYDLQGDFNQFSLGNGAEEFGVISCRFVFDRISIDRELTNGTDSTALGSWPCLQIIT